jgi:macrolide-specific efflux system membrane fusion protein
MKGKSKTILRWLLAVAILLALGSTAKAVFFSAAPNSSYLTAKAVVKDLEDTVLATGELKAFNLVSVGAQASGQVKSLKVALGDKVKKGQLIAEIDSLTQQNALKTAEASLRDAQAQRLAKEATLRQAEAALKRKQLLAKEDAGSKQDYEDALAARDVAREEIKALGAQIDKARVEVATAQVNLGYTKITAPMDGVVVAIITKQGQTVNAAQSAPTIIMLAQLDVMTVEAEISEADVVRVKPGQQVYFTILGEPDRRYDATLRAIEPAPESIKNDDTASSSTSGGSSSSSSSSSSAVYYNGLFDVPNPDGKLRISMTAQCTIVLSRVKDAVCVPATALGPKDREGRYLVRVLGQDGRPLDRQVRVGINDGTQAQILEGVQAGEQVIISEAGQASSQDGQTNRNRPPPPMRL